MANLRALIYNSSMEKICEICGSTKSPDNKLFTIRIIEQSDDETQKVRSRVFCEVCLGYGADMYESYMVTKMTPKSVSGGSCKKAH